MGRIYDYKANYSHYLQLREERRAQQLKQYLEQQKVIADIQGFIDRFKGTYSKTNQVNSRERMLEKIVPIEIDEIDTSSLKLRFPLPHVRATIQLRQLVFPNRMTTMWCLKRKPLDCAR